MDSDHPTHASHPNDQETDDATHQTLNVCLVSGYDAQSHKSWRDALSTSLSQLGHQVHIETEPPRHFRWRFSSNAIPIAQRLNALEQSFDLMLCTSMVNVAPLRGLYSTNAKWVTYFHENQLAFPVQSGKPDPKLGMQTYYTIAASDHIVLNSTFNLSSLRDGLDTWRKMMPEKLPELPALNSASIIPVPLPDHYFIDSEVSKPAPPIILWNHRWEFDKNPDDFLALLRLLRSRDFAFRLAVVGQSFREQPNAFGIIKQEFADQIVAFGFLESSDAYRSLLKKSRFVVSTSNHEFQGLSVLEATASGAIPIVPGRLVYPEIYPKQFCYDSIENAADKILEFNAHPPSLPPLSAFRGDAVEKQWSDLLHT